MASVAKRLGASLISNVAGDLYTVPASTTTIVKSITLCNAHTGAVTVDLKFNNIHILKGYSIDANKTITIPYIDHVLLTGEKINMVASVNAVVSIYVSGKEVS